MIRGRRFLSGCRTRLAPLVPLCSASHLDLNPEHHHLFRSSARQRRAGSIFQWDTWKAELPLSGLEGGMTTEGWNSRAWLGLDGDLDDSDRV